jgi:hypothetical protein
MGERPNQHALNVLDAARKYGDARVAAEKALRAWDMGQDRSEMDAAYRAALEAEGDLFRLARAYATQMRRRRPNPPPITGEER